MRGKIRNLIRRVRLTIFSTDGLELGPQTLAKVNNTKMRTFFLECGSTASESLVFRRALTLDREVERGAIFLRQSESGRCTDIIVRSTGSDTN